MGKNTYETGRRYEQEAAEYLRKCGIIPIEMNFRCRSGEIDLVGREGETLVFVEIKYRSSSAFGDGTEAVAKGKQQKIIRTARYYLYRSGLPADTSCRFDVIGITGKKICHIRNAFGLDG